MGNLNTLSTVRKALASLILATLIAIIPIIGSNGGQVTVTSKLLIAIAVLSGVMTYFVPNFPQFPWLKTLVAALMAGVAFLVTVVTSDCPALRQIVNCVALINWIQCAIMVLKAAGIYVIPNDPPQSS
jgi:hypothetical protein